MKFLCVDCDSQMALSETRGPDQGSMTVVFTCKSCERQIAMLTNAQETQMVHSLGVKIGGRKSEPRSMETIRGSLVGAAGDGASAPDATPAPTATSAPDATPAPAATSAPDAPPAPAATSAPDATPAPVTDESESEGKCPFSTMVVEGSQPQFAQPDGIQWTSEAEERLQNIPSFIRSMVKRGIEDHAKAQGVKLIDKEVMASVRENMGM